MDFGYLAYFANRENMLKGAVTKILEELIKGWVIARLVKFCVRMKS